MVIMAASLFAEGLIENNIDKLLKAPKSDLHNHSTRGFYENDFVRNIISVKCTM